MTQKAGIKPMLLKLGWPVGRLAGEEWEMS